MTQRVFDVENEKDMQDLWKILPDDVVRISPVLNNTTRIEFDDDEFNTILFKINWHDNTEITRPIKEATEEDIGKICAFWEDGYNKPVYSRLYKIKENERLWKYIAEMDTNGYEHCRRLNEKEIEELC